MPQTITVILLQGANLAIEDAVVLADVARQHGGVLSPQVREGWWANGQAKQHSPAQPALP